MLKLKNYQPPFKYLKVMFMTDGKMRMRCTGIRVYWTVAMKRELRQRQALDLLFQLSPMFLRFGT